MLVRTQGRKNSPILTNSRFTFYRVIDGKLLVKTALPGLKIEYSTDEGVTWNDVTQETKVRGEIRLRTR